jgi:uncharacterized protein (TIGR02147 family)
MQFQESLHSHTDYKSYMNQRLDSDPRGRGSRAALAKAIRCQSAYVSSVLRGKAHFTPEQGEAINAHLGHSEAESDYFLLLLQSQRAGSEALRARLRRQMQRVLESRFDLKLRLPVSQALTKEVQATYYSEWYYAAIHALSSVPGFGSVSALAARLKIEPSRVAEAVNFLLSVGLIVKGKRGFGIGQARIHLGSESPFISRHHQNWRLQAIQRVSRRAADDLHYSSVVTLSGKDAILVKEKIVAFIRDLKDVVRDSKEEKLQCFSLDFFEV